MRSLLPWWPNIVTFAGAVIAYNAGVNRAIGIFTCWIALFAPGIMLIYGVMPWWGSFRRFQIYRRWGISLMRQPRGSCQKEASAFASGWHWCCAMQHQSCLHLLLMH